MQLIVHTKLGVFHSVPQEADEATQKDVKAMLKNIAEDGTHMVLDTKDGYVVLGRDALQNAVFEVKN